MDWKKLLSDKRFLAAGAVAAGAGVYVLIRRKQSTGTTASGQTAATGSGAPTLDTTSTDVASQLGQYGAAEQATLNDFINQLKGILTGLGGSTGGSGTGTPGPKPKPKPVPSPAPAPNPGGATHGNPAPHGSVTVVPFTRNNPAWNSTLSGIAGREHVALSQILALNPQIHDPNLIHPGDKIAF